MHIHALYNMHIDELEYTSTADFLQKNPDRGFVSRILNNCRQYTVSNVLCCGRPYQSLLPIQEGHPLKHILQESITEDNESRFQFLKSALRHSETEHIVTIEEAAPLFPVWSDNFWHFSCETLTRLCLLEAAGYTGAYIIPTQPAFVASSLAIFKIDPSRILPSTQSYIIKRAIFLEHIISATFNTLNLLGLNLLRQAMLTNVPVLKGKKRCYISRIGTRRVLNEKDLITMLEPMGFEVMTPEHMPSVAAQFSYMTNVTCAVMPHGSNGVLGLAQPAGAHFFELFGKNYVNNCHGPLLKAAQLYYHQMVEYVAPGTHDDHSDFEVDLDFLRFQLNTILKDPAV